MANTLVTDCPVCGLPLRLVGTIVVSPVISECRVDLDLHPFSARRHAGCFGGGGPGGREYVTLMPGARAFGAGLDEAV